MKQVIVQAFCDGDHDEPTPAVSERTASLDGSKPVLLDVCEQCDNMFVILLRLMERGAVLDEAPKAKKPGKKHGPKVSDGPIRKPAEEPVEEPARTGRIPQDELPTVCPVCLHKSVTRSALGQHLRTSHDTGLKVFTLAQFEEAARRLEAGEPAAEVPESA